MGVMLQAFYWDCLKAENCEHQWAYTKSKLPTIAQAGFTALWLSPANFRATGNAFIPVCTRLGTAPLRRHARPLPSRAVSWHRTH
jgi:hypothetical protein